jgi:phage-related protein
MKGKEEKRGWKIGEYTAPNGEKPVITFLLGLKGKHKRQAIALLQLLAERGNMLREPQSKMVDTGLFELRGHQVRIFYTYRPGQRIELLDGFVKKQDEIPWEVLKRVRAYRQALEEAERKAAGGP